MIFSDSFWALGCACQWRKRDYPFRSSKPKNSSPFFPHRKRGFVVLGLGLSLGLEAGFQRGDAIRWRVSHAAMAQLDAWQNADPRKVRDVARADVGEFRQRGATDE